LRDNVSTIREGYQMNLKDINILDKLIHIPSGAYSVVVERDEWSITVFHGHTFDTSKINSDAGLSLYKQVA